MEYNYYQYQNLIKLQLRNDKDIDENRKKIYEIIHKNISKVYFDSELSFRGFELATDISHSTLAKHIFPGNFGLPVDFEILVKISTYMDIPIECLTSNISEEDLQFLEELHRLKDDEKEEVRREIRKKITKKKNKHNTRKNKNMKISVKEEKTGQQMTIFDFLDKLNTQERSE